MITKRYGLSKLPRSGRGKAFIVFCALCAIAVIVHSLKNTGGETVLAVVADDIATTSVVVMVRWNPELLKWQTVSDDGKSVGDKQLKIFLETTMSGDSYGLIGLYSQFEFEVKRHDNGPYFTLPYWKTVFESNGEALGESYPIPGLIRIPVRRKGSTYVLEIPSLKDLQRAEWESWPDGKRPPKENAIVSFLKKQLKQLR